MNEGGKREEASSGRMRACRVVSEHQAALEVSDLWKLYQAIVACTDRSMLLSLARDANAEFIRNRLPDHVPG